MGLDKKCHLTAPSVCIWARLATAARGEQVRLPDTGASMSHESLHSATLLFNVALAHLWR